MRRLLGYARPYWRVVSVSVALMLVASVLQVIGPLLTKLAVDRYLAPAGATTAGILEAWLSPVPRTGLTQLSLLYLAALMLGLL